jgi:hypothetical protein
MFYMVYLLGTIHVTVFCDECWIRLQNSEATAPQLIEAASTHVPD